MKICRAAYACEVIRFFQMPDTCDKSADLLYDLCCGNSTIISRSAAGYSWMTEFLAEIVTPTLKPEQILRQYMEVHYNEDLTLEKLAAQVRLRQRQLFRKTFQRRNRCFSMRISKADLPAHFTLTCAYLLSSLLHIAAHSPAHTCERVVLRFAAVRPELIFLYLIIKQSHTALYQLFLQCRHIKCSKIIRHRSCHACGFPCHGTYRNHAGNIPHGISC